MLFIILGVVAYLTIGIFFALHMCMKSDQPHGCAEFMTDALLWPVIILGTLIATVLFTS